MRVAAARSGGAGDFEEADGGLQLLRLAGQFLGGGGHFLGRRGVLLNDLVQLLKRLVDLVHARCSVRRWRR